MTVMMRWRQRRPRLPDGAVGDACARVPSAEVVYWARPAEWKRAWCPRAATDGAPARHRAWRWAARLVHGAMRAVA